MPRTINLAPRWAAVACAALLVSASAAAAEPPLAPLAESAPPPPPLEAAPKYESPGMRITGIVLTSTGAAALIAGGVLVAAGLAQGSNAPQSPYYSFFPPGFNTMFAGFVSLGAGALHVAIGIPLWVVGARPPKAEAPARIPSWAVPTVAAGPRSAALRWTF